jgi:hypothetical protein
MGDIDGVRFVDINGDVGNALCYGQLSANNVRYRVVMTGFGCQRRAK